MARRNWNKCHDCGIKVNIKKQAKSGHGYTCTACYLKDRRRAKKDG
jgi:hypothetical protein|tara:strand:- start:4195 stop:4332 length:138 start_codon:yes stop_codon:yes gene_type:complete